MGNAVVHFEIGAAADGPLTAFYGELFAWDLAAAPGGGYTVIDTRGDADGINGGIGKIEAGLGTWARAGVTFAAIERTSHALFGLAPSPARLFLVPTLVSVVTGLLLATVFPDVRGSGVPQTEAAFQILRKLDPLGPPMIHTQRGVGYSLRPPEQGQAGSPA